MKRITLMVVTTLLTLEVAPALAQPQMPPPPHGGAMSAPLFVQDLPVGTVSVRIARASMTEAVADVEVTGAWTTRDGKQHKASAKTGNDGRAVFSGIPEGSSFSATISVEGQNLATEPFVVPEEGGTRLLVIVGAEAAQAMADMTGTTGGGELPPGHPSVAKTPALRAGKVEAKDGIAPGTLEIRVLGSDGKPLAQTTVSLVRPKHGTGTVNVERAVADDTGTARFEGLPTGEADKYAAALDHEGLRLATDVFTLETGRGASGEIRMPKKTSSLSALRISSTSRILLEAREKALGVLQNLVIENPSDEVFDPGPRGLVIPLPEGFTGGEKLQGGADVEIKEGIGAVLHQTVPPSKSGMEAVQVRIGYIMSTHEAASFELVQPMPLGLEGGLAMVPGEIPLTLSAPGLRPRPPERDDNGSELRIWDLDAVAPGQALRLTVLGLPSRDKTGQWIAGVLVGLLVLWGVFALRRPRASTKVEAG